MVRKGWTQPQPGEDQDTAYQGNSCLSHEECVHSQKRGRAVRHLMLISVAHAKDRQLGREAGDRLFSWTRAVMPLTQRLCTPGRGHCTLLKFGVDGPRSH